MYVSLSLEIRKWFSEIVAFFFFLFDKTRRDAPSLDFPNGIIMMILLRRKNNKKKIDSVIAFEDFFFSPHKS